MAIRVFGKPDSLIHSENETRQLKAVYCEGSVCETIHAETLSNEELLALDVDILVPAALSGVISEQNAENVRAGVVLELANGPTEDAADAVLDDEGVLVVPDILANAGGVTLSYLEWVQNRSGDYWSEDEVNGRLDNVKVVPVSEGHRKRLHVEILLPGFEHSGDSECVLA